MRHDLRTPINAIKGYGEMLREDAADGNADALVADLDKLLGEATLLLDRIDGLVAFSGSDAPPLDGAAATQADAPVKMVEICSRRSARSRRRKPTARPYSPAEFGGGRQCVEPRPSSRRLQRQGHTVLQDKDGAAALATVEKEALDLVLLDLMMPGVSGYDVLTLLKNDPRFREIPVIMISALTELDSIVRCIEAGADDYLAKPFDPTLLRARVGSSLEKKHLRDREREMVEALRIEKERSEHLLLNILPKGIVTRMKRARRSSRINYRTLLFCFPISSASPNFRPGFLEGDLVRLINELFSEFDLLRSGSGSRK